MAKCIRCFTEHNREWDRDSSTGLISPARFCEDCAQIKNASIDVIDEIAPNLFLSGIVAAGKFNGKRICVHERTPKYEGQYHHIPILSKRCNSDTDRRGAVVSIDAIERVTHLIHDYQQKKEPLLVHCVGGVERSPLTLAWYFVRTRKFETLEQAYEYIISKRPVVSKRLFWLPEYGLQTLTVKPCLLSNENGVRVSGDPPI